jgi:hypothetical protein
MLPDQAVFLMIMGVVSTIAFFAVLVVWGIINFLTPKPAKTITRASWFHNTIAFIFQSNHVTRIVRCKVHQGYLETIEKKVHRIPILRPSYQAPIEAHTEDYLTEEGKKELLAKEKVLQQSNRDILEVEKQILTPTTLEGTRTPAFFVYDGVAVAVTPEAILGLSYRDKAFNGGVFDSTGKTVYPIKVLLGLDPPATKRYISALMDQTSEDAGFEDGRALGQREGKNEKIGKLFIYGGIGLAILGFAALALSAFIT